MLYTWGTKGQKDGEFDSPMGVAVGAYDLIYVSDSQNHRIQCFDSRGTFIRKWGQRGNKDGEFNSPRSLAIGTFEDEGVTTAMQSVSELAAFPPGLLSICVAYARNEYLYVCDWGNDRIQVFDTSEKVRFMHKWGQSGHADGRFWRATGCSVGKRDGLVYVVDSSTGEIQVFDRDGTCIRRWNNGDGKRNIDIFASCDGYIYTLDGYVVRCYDNRGNLIYKWRIDGVEYRPAVSICIDDKNERVYLTDIGRHCIIQCHKDGTHQKTWGKEGNGNGEFDIPYAISTGTNGILYVADMSNHRIVACRMDTE